MKKTLLLFILAFVLAFCAACTPISYAPQGGASDGGTSESPSDSLPTDPNPGEGIGDGYDVITVARALELCGEAGNVTEERYYLLVTVDSVLNPQYGEMNVSDETGTIYVYGAYSHDGALRYSEMDEKPYKGDTVLLYCILQNHNGTKEVKNAYIIDFEPAVFEDDGTYTKMTVKEARNAEVGEKIEVSGVVAAISYAFGHKPNGVYLIDSTSSIYVYGADVAGRVEVGNTVTVAATKAYWILEDEKTNAALHGYKGCNQLENPTLVENDQKVSDFPTQWVTETTLKELLETPVSQDITTLIYKVNALVRKVEGTGFTNYYFFDIDGETGAYTYTQCSGSDFAWVDQFDGKICTVYLCAMNAKSSATACSFRLFPVKIIDENYTFNTDDAGEYAVKYHALDSFQAVYNANPQTVLPTAVSSELLGFEGATLSYKSDNEKVAYFEMTDGGTVFNLGEYGTAKITVTGSYGGKSYSETLEVTYEAASSYDYITVAEAIKVAPNTDESQVTVKGIVGPSVVNRNGFYLFGEDGSVITVLVASTDYFADLSIGNMVILRGERERFVKDDASAFTGQSCIVNGEILVNYYGNHQYSTAKFVEATGAEFYALDDEVDYSTTVFVIRAKVEYIITPYYTSMKLIAEDGTEIGLYMSGMGQYSFLDQFKGQTLEMEVAACNWNDKDYWRGCVLAVRNSDGTKTYNTLNFDSY